MLVLVSAGEIDAADFPCQKRDIGAGESIWFGEACYLFHVSAERIRSNLVAFVVAASLSVELDHKLMAFLVFGTQVWMVFRLEV